jgi:hypothetical protein
MVTVIYEKTRNAASSIYYYMKRLAFNRAMSRDLFYATKKPLK